MSKTIFMLRTIVAAWLLCLSFHSAQSAESNQTAQEKVKVVEQFHPPDGNPRTVYLSTGDNQHLLNFPPLDSRTTIETAFEALQKNYQVSRIWWRGGQDEVWGKQFVLRKANRFFANIWQWWKLLAYEKVGTNRIAVQAAHDRGMEIWMTYGLFDNGSQADVGYMDFPYAMEDRLRVEHPEWVPVNKYGTWRQGGPIAFCYPGARKILSDYLTKYVVEGDYDGIAFLTYAENYSQRYEDEFGYNQPIVDEFKKRHGVDIRTEPFDKAAWSELRGEYLTQFFRELRASLAKHNKKIAVCVDGHNPHLPCVWNHNQVRTAGRIHLDLETWVREQLVDELNVYTPHTKEALRQCLAICQGSKTVCSAFRTGGKLPAGVPRIMWLGMELESGFDSAHRIDWPDENVTQQPLEALQGDDPCAKRRLLTMVLKKKQTVPSEAVLRATTDADVYVRLLALQVLGTMKDSQAVPVVQAALLDPENSVRCRAALVLGELAGAQCVGPLFEAVARKSSTFQFSSMAVLETLRKLHDDGQLDAAHKEQIAAKISDPNPKVSKTALYVLLRIGAPSTSAVEQSLIHVLQNDPDPYARELAIKNLASSFGPVPRVLAEVREAMRDQDEFLQVRAAATLISLLRLLEPSETRTQALAEVLAFFRQYGDDCTRSDADWGWRVVGNGLLTLGDEGKKLLTDILTDKSDRRLAEIAWYVVYLPQGDQLFKITEEQDQEAHRHFPFRQ